MNGGSRLVMMQIAIKKCSAKFDNNLYKQIWKALWCLIEKGRSKQGMFGYSVLKPDTEGYIKNQALCTILLGYVLSAPYSHRMTKQGLNLSWLRKLEFRSWLALFATSQTAFLYLQQMSVRGFCPTAVCCCAGNQTRVTESQVDVHQTGTCVGRSTGWATALRQDAEYHKTTDSLKSVD